MAVKKLPLSIRRAIKRFENATTDLAFKGSAHPSDHEDIASAHTEAETHLVKAILKHIKGAQDA